jgi:hypothetical protein
MCSALPFLFLKPASRLLRRLAGKTVRQDAAEIPVDVVDWHEYSLSWGLTNARFEVDGQLILETSVSPLPPLGLLFWIDNQFAAWTPEGYFSFGTLDNPSAWLEIESYAICR